MEAKNSKLEYFDIKNLPLVVDVVVPLWSPPIGDKEFKRFNVEYIVRMNMFDNDLNYQLVDADNGTLLSSAFLAKKGDASKAEEWFAEASKKYPDNLKIASKMSHDYIELMDTRTFSLMNDDGHFDAADFAGAQVVPQVSYDSETWYSLGTFFFASHKSAGGVIICTAYDALALMDEAEFSSWPCTFLQAAQAVCTAHGLTLAATSFDGASMSFTDPGVTMTERMTLSYMAQCTGNHVRINAAGELVIEKVTGDTKAVSSVFEANLQTAVINYTGVRITPYGSDSSTLFESEGNVMAVSDNPVITTSNVATIGQTLQTYLGAVNIAAYSPGDADILSDFTLEPGDVLTFDDPRGVSHDFMVANLIYKLGVRASARRFVSSASSFFSIHS